MDYRKMVGWMGILSICWLGETAVAWGQADPSQKVAQVLARFAHEPSVFELQKAALAQSHLHPAIMEAVLKRIHGAAMLPEIRVQAGKTTRRQDTLSEEVGAPDHYDLTGESQLQLIVRATWQLDRLVFNDAELRWHAQAKQEGERRDELLMTVTRLYFERRRLQAEQVLSPSQDENVIMQRLLRIEELTALLDALTGGFLSQAKSGSNS